MYVTDALKAIADNTANVLSEGGVGLSRRYFDLLIENERQQTVQPDIDETQKATDIINHMKYKINHLGV